MTEDTRTADRRFKLKGWHIALVVLIMLVMLIALHLVVYRNRVEERVRALRAAGYPTTFAELAEYTKLPEGIPNACEVYIRAFAAFVPPVDEANVPILGKARLPDRGVPLPEPMAKATAECLAANQRCLALLHEAAGLEQCRYTWDYEDRLSLWKTQPHTEGLRQGLRLLCLSTIYHVHAGDVETVVTRIRDGLRLAESMRREPGVSGYMMRTASRAVMLNGLERVLSVATFTDQQLAELSRMLAASIATLDLKEAFITERCFAIEKFKAIEKSGPPSLRHLLRTGEIILWAPGVQARGLPDTLDYMEKYVQAADLPTRERMAWFRQVQNELAGRSILHATAKAWAPFFLGRIFELDPRIRVHFDLARTALAIERYRLTIGQVPENLEELIPQYLEQVPIDPFDGQPIRYRRTQPGYVLYSVDPDGQDNGGRERSETDRGAPSDWCFIVTR